MQRTDRKVKRLKQLLGQMMRNEDIESLNDTLENFKSLFNKTKND